VTAIEKSDVRVIVNADFTGVAKLYVAAFLVVLISELIGKVSFSAGYGKIVLLPLLWAVLVGGAWSFWSYRLPSAVAIGVPLQMRASRYLQLALFLVISKLGLMVGGSIPKLLASGPGLLFQEFGHFFGTMFLGLPIALLLGIKREAIGATFSVGREPSLAIIGERFGMDSAEGRGVLAEYLTGTVFGAVFIAILAGFVTSLGVFNPIALAMGAGIGSGSMMAAATGAIAAQQTPEVAKDVATFAAASNLITSIVGPYFTLFLSLPATIFMYGILEPRIGQHSVVSSTSSAPPEVQGDEHVTDWPELLLVWLLCGAYAVFGSWYNYSTPADGVTLAGASIIIGVVVIGYTISQLIGGKIPAVICISLLGTLLTYPGLPGSALVAEITGRINFLACATPILALAGLSVAKDLPAFRRLGWRIVVTSLAATAGTFISATIIAQFFMRSA
jgi:hypothetical protein